jgi:hypothetical protein
LRHPSVQRLALRPCQDHGDAKPTRD